jgi:SAM-dependent methyltransferase
MKTPATMSMPTLWPVESAASTARKLSIGRTPLAYHRHVDDRLDAYLELAAVSDEEFVRRAYRLVLRRDPEPPAFERRVSRATLLRDLVTSDEFERLRALDEAIEVALGGGDPAQFLEAPPDLDERAIEIPWALSRLGAAQRVLDLGTANAEPAYLAALLAAAPRELVGADLVGVDVPGFLTVVADVRRLPFPDRSFDLVLCISTLEHVGRDNRLYGVEDTETAGGIEAALLELHRVVGRRGRLVVTVPCGEPEERDWFVQHDRDAWNRLFLDAGFAVAAQEVSERRPEGWRAADPFDPAGVRYGERGAGASGVLCTELRPRPLWRQLVRPTPARAAAGRSGGDAHGPRRGQRRREG